MKRSELQTDVGSVRTTENFEFANAAVGGAVESTALFLVEDQSEQA